MLHTIKRKRKGKESFNNEVESELRAEILKQEETK